MTRYRAIGVAIGVLAAAALRAQDNRSVEVVVTSVAGRSLYLDKGRDDGLATGTRVRLFPPGGPLELDVLVVTATSARVDLPPGIETPAIGTRGEASVAPTRDDAGRKPTRPNNPAHPPWTRIEGDRRPEDPLLAPAFRSDPRSRPSDLHGRAHLLALWNRDQGDGRASDWLLGRLGVEATWRNPFGDGGLVRFAGDLDHRRLRLQDADDSDDTNGRLDLLSYATGTEEYAPLRLEFGRFYSDALPELGLLDGVEAIAQFDDGWRLGGGAGSWPRPFPARDTGEDLGVHAFVDWTEPRQRRWSWTAGLQKTWHHGDPDRDLAVLRAQYRSGGGFWLFGTARVDLHTAKDDLESTIEPSHALLQARFDERKFGLGATASHFSWPQLLRDEYVALPDELIRDGRVDRIGIDAWWRPLTDLRLSARGDAWWDQDRQGHSGEVGADWADALGTDTTIMVTLFQNSGGFWAGPGSRVRVRREFGEVQVSAGWNRYRFDTENLLGGAATYTRQSVDLSLDVPLGDVDLAITGERWFGDQQDAFALTLWLQHRF
ncbi:MAG: hypothetical protein IPK26_31760 [Planctomycetes bacterium]|nr:hypothetical protein [Planctomycetota bacterium]